MDYICNFEEVTARDFHYHPGDCTKCALHTSRTKIVWSGKGCPMPMSPWAKILIVGEAPGEQEDLQGFSFVGRSGELLYEALGAADLNAIGNDSSVQVYITNVVKCRPPGNRNPTKEEMEACYPNLQVQYTFQQPELIVVLGKVAAEFILQRPVKITKEHGNLDFINDGYKDVPVLICYHPAYVLRNQKPEIKQGFFQAIKDARRIAYGTNDRVHEESSR